MTIRQNGVSRPDNSSSIVGDRGDRVSQDQSGRQFSDSQDIRTRSSLAEDEIRNSFGVLMDSRNSIFPNVVAPLSGQDTQSLIHYETGNQMPYTPAEGNNLIFTRMYATLDNDARLSLLIDAQLIDTLFLKGGDVINHQTAELFELAETVTDLDGSHTVEYQLDVPSEQEVQGSVFFRTVERPIRQ